MSSFWDEIVYFKPHEFDTGDINGGRVCGTGRLFMKEHFIRKLDLLRERCGFPLPVSSGYRSKIYNNHIGATQTHASGEAADIECSHEAAYIILKHALEIGFTGIGINQKGNKRFIHLDTLEAGYARPRPHVWSY